MALEYKTLNVGNSKADDIVEIHASFGWELHSSQRVLDSNTHFEVANYDELHQVTETTDFTKLVFKREKKMANYDEVVAREYEYYAALKKISDLKDEEARAAKALNDFLDDCDLRSKKAKTVIFVVQRFLIISLIGSFIWAVLLMANEPSIMYVVAVILASTSLYSLPVVAFINSKIKKKARKKFRENIGDNNNPYVQRYNALFEEHLKTNADFANLVTRTEERNEEIGNLRSKASRAISAAEKLI